MPSSTPAFSWENDDLSKREIDVIDHVVRYFLSTRNYHPELILEDLTQECLVHWWIARSKFNSNRGASIETFLRRVVNAKLVDLERGVKAQKRGGGRAVLSLDQSLSADDLDSETLAETLSDLADTSRESVERVALEQARSLLNLRQNQIIAGLVDELPMSKISEALGVPRATLYDELNRIRQIFLDEGLAPFFDYPDT